MIMCLWIIIDNIDYTPCPWVVRPIRFSWSFRLSGPVVTASETKTCRSLIEPTTTLSADDVRRDIFAALSKIPRIPFPRKSRRAGAAASDLHPPPAPLTAETAHTKDPRHRPLDCSTHLRRDSCSPISGLRALPGEPLKPFGNGRWAPETPPFPRQVAGAVAGRAPRPGPNPPVSSSYPSPAQTRPPPDPSPRAQKDRDRFPCSPHTTRVRGNKASGHSP